MANNLGLVVGTGFISFSIIWETRSLGYALRALSRDRATVQVSVQGGGPLLGTIDAVGADHLDLAEHLDGLPRRRENVRAVATVPFAALVAVESRR